MFDLDLALRFGAALGLGLLLGLERERKRDLELLFGGVRTFALIALLGAIGAFLERELNQGWLVLAAFVAVSALVAVSYAMTAARGELGITTEITALLAFIVGALCGWDKVAVASVATVVCLLLLTLKDYLHRLARRVELADVEATLKFAVISVIILPLLPNETFGPPPVDVINPYKIWLMVVLIAGLNFMGYVLVKVLGNEHGLVVTGILGGLVSSTAVTLELRAAKSTRGGDVVGVRTCDRSLVDDHVFAGGGAGGDGEPLFGRCPRPVAWFDGDDGSARIARALAADSLPREGSSDRWGESFRARTGD